MRLNRFMFLGMVAALSLTLVTGCSGPTNATQDPSSKQTKNTENTSEIIECGTGLVNTNEIPEFDIIGEVIEIDENRVHILFGDIIEIFEVSNATEVYLGETVQVVGDQGNQSLKPFMIENFAMKHTNMGHIIEVAKGSVVSVKQDVLTLKTDRGEIVFETFEMADLDIGMEVEVEYVLFNGPEGEKSVLKVLPLDLNMTMTIESIERSESGLLIFKGVEESGMESYVDISTGTNDNFNLSELKVGDTVEVIPEVIMESYPMQVKPLRVRLIEE